MPFYCRMAGLPYQLTDRRISSWFKENGVSGDDVEIHIILNRDFRPSGMGFAVLKDRSDLDAALDLDGRCVGDSQRYVKMYQTDEQECRWYLDRQRRHKEGGSRGDADVPLHLVRLRGVPFKVNEYEIAQWFRNGCGVEPVDVQCGTTRSTHGLANAFFKNEGDASKALRMDKADMEGRYIELSMDQVPVTFSDEAHNPCTLRMNGVPYKTNSQELKDFFRDHAECLDVRVVLNRDGFPSGDAVAFFADEAAVEAAMQCNKKNLGQRYVVLQPNGGGGGGSSGGASHRNGSSNGHERTDDSGLAVKMNGLPYDATEDDIHEFFNKVDAKCQNVRFLKNRGGRNSGEAVVTFGSKKEVEAALERNRDYLGSRYVIINQY